VIKGIKVEGVRELNRALAAANKEFPKRIARANKAIGDLIISRVFPQPRSSGAGRGAAPRATASRNFVAIRAGRTERKHYVQQWGTRYVPRDNPRPYILRAAQRSVPDIEQRYLDGIETVLRQISDQ
jgi:hypothetical protein